jgi:hypothetical protein
MFLFSETCRMKSPVVFCDPVGASKQRAKLSQEGSYIPIFINLTIIEKLPDDRYKNKFGEKRKKKNTPARADNRPGKNAEGLSALHFTGPDSDGGIYRHDKDFPIAYPAGLCSTDNGCDEIVNLPVPHNNLNLNLRKHIYRHLLAPVLEGNSFLLPPSLDFCGSHGRNSFFL